MKSIKDFQNQKVTTVDNVKGGAHYTEGSAKKGISCDYVDGNTCCIYYADGRETCL